MKCKNCDYPLWDLKPGPCPECGESFSPVSERFKPGEVRFCCPHCDQAYYGDGENGHLVPAAFDCVECGAGIDESECVIRPREDRGYEYPVTADVAPCFDPTLGRWKRFWRTVAMSMTRPRTLGEGIPIQSRIRPVFGFAAILSASNLVVGTLPIFLLIGVPFFLMGAGATLTIPEVLVLVVVFLGLGLLSVCMALAGITLVGAIIHGVLRMSGTTRGGIGRTISCACLGSGPLILGSVPVLGPYCLQTPAAIWGIVSTILILSVAQGVSGLRATLSVLTPLFVLIGLYVSVLIAVFAIGVTVPAGPAGGAGFGPLGSPAAQASLTINGRETSIDFVAVLDLLGSRKTLPDLAEFEASAGGGKIPGLGSAPVLTRFEGRGFEGWWVPGLMVLKGVDADAFAVLEVDPRSDVSHDPASWLTSEQGSSRELRMKFRERTRDGVNRQAGPTISAENFQSLSELVEGVGGNAEDLAADVPKSWIAASLSAIEKASSPEDSGSIDVGKNGSTPDETSRKESEDLPAPLEGGPANAGG